MTKPNTSKQKEISSIEDMPIVKLKKGVKSTKYKPSNNPNDHEI